MTGETKLRQWPDLTKAREAELIGEITSKLDPSQRDAIEARCERMRQEFRLEFVFDNDEDNVVPSKMKHDTLVEIGEFAAKLSGAIFNGALQDEDWLPRRENNYEFTVEGRRFQLSYSSTQIGTMIGALSELAKERAKKFVPGGRRELEKDRTAFYAYELMVEFPPPRRAKLRISKADRSDESWYKKRQPQTKPQQSEEPWSIRQYIEGKWARLGPHFQGAYNALLRERNRWRRLSAQLPGDAPIPLTSGPERHPSHSEIVQEPSTSPDGPYLSIAPLLFEYFTGQEPEKGLERSCRKVLALLRPDRSP
jgi:hypothetical protein